MRAQNRFDDPSAVHTVVPNYEGAQLLRKYVPGMIREVGCQSELLIIDDCSGDGSADVIRRHCADVITVVRRVNGGFEAAILRLLENPSLAEEMGSAGVRYVAQKWNWQDSVRQLEVMLSRSCQLKCQSNNSEG